MTQEIPRFGTPTREAQRAAPRRRTVESELFGDETLWSAALRLSKGGLKVLGPAALLVTFNYFVPILPSGDSIDQLGQMLKETRAEPSNNAPRSSRPRVVRRTKPVAPASSETAATENSEPEQQYVAPSGPPSGPPTGPNAPR